MKNNRSPYGLQKIINLWSIVNFYFPFFKFKKKKMKLEHRLSFFIFQLEEKMNDPKIHALETHSFFYLFFYKNVVFPAQAEYSYFSADFRLKIFMYYS